VTPPLAAWGLAGVTGLAVGSYAATAAMRFARGEAHVRGRSHCDGCGRTLGFARTLPVVSFLALRGACADCGARIARLHPLGEAAGAAVALGALWVASDAGAWRAAPLLAIGFALLAAAVVDLRVRRLPDALTAVVAVGGALLAAGRGLPMLALGALVAVLATCVLLAIRALSRRRIGDPGLGLGDVKLIGALALWLGPATPLMVGLAAGLGLAAAALDRSGEPRRPFGPALALAGWGVGLALELGWTPWAP